MRGRARTLFGASVTALVFAALAGCAPVPTPTASGTPAAPTASPTPTPAIPIRSAVPYSESLALRASLARLSVAAGDVTGTWMQGSRPRDLTGKVAFSGAGSSVSLILGGSTTSERSEIVAGGKRYLRIDDGPWVGRGAVVPGKSLAATLAGADTVADEGLFPIG